MDVYSNAVDMWSLGCVVHELLTTERPFLEAGHQDGNTESEVLSGLDTSERQADIDMIIEFCRAERDFPEEALQASGASTNAILLVKGLLRADPCLRTSAAEALGNLWLSEESKSDNIDVDRYVIFHPCRIRKVDLEKNPGTVRILT